MARHRNVRNMSYEDDLSEDVYGRSLDELDYAISPATEAQFMYSRRDHTLSSFIGEPRINEEEEDTEETDHVFSRTSEFVKPSLSSEDEARLQAGLETIRDVMGESVDDATATQALICYDYDAERALNSMLNDSKGGKQTLSSVVALEPDPYAAGSVTIAKSKTPRKMDSNPETASVRLKMESVSLRDSDKSQAMEINESNPPPALGVNSSTKLEVTEPLNGLAQANEQTPSRSAGTKPKETFNVKEACEERDDGLDLLNMVVIGHVDAGKSTLMGHLLYKLGRVSKKMMHKNETESKKLGKGSFAFAWVLDETEEERSRGITMDVAMTTFETKTKRIILMDAPGHRDFIPNMIQGTAQADVSILVVDSGRGAFEAGFESGGQTREHALLARSLGVGQLIVAVNKLDSVNWSHERYIDITSKLKVFLKQAGFRDADVAYIPCSGLTGDNLVERASDPVLRSWYDGCCLTEQIDKFKPPERPIDKPFRMCVSDVYKGQSNTFVVAGKVESGYVINSNKVLLMPAGEPGSVKTLMIRDEPVKFAAVGDHISMAVSGVDMAHVYVGSILCDPVNPIRATQRLTARIVVFNTDMPIVKGFMVVFHCQNLSEPAVVSKLVSILNKTTGEIIQRRPRCLPKQSNAVIEVSTTKPICVELYKDNRVLGRFMLRASGKTIAAGVVTEIK